MSLQLKTEISNIINGMLVNYTGQNKTTDQTWDYIQKTVSGVHTTVLPAALAAFQGFRDAHKDTYKIPNQALDEWNEGRHFGALNTRMHARTRTHGHTHAHTRTHIHKPIHTWVIIPKL